MGHLRANGYDVQEKNVSDLSPIKRRYHVPKHLEACHTALVQGYVVEGHVPADLIGRLLRERPSVLGLAVPGMPVGSPGMEVGNRQDAYDVLLVLVDGSSRVYQSYPSKTVKSSLKS